MHFRLSVGYIWANCLGNGPALPGTCSPKTKCFSAAPGGARGGHLPRFPTQAPILSVTPPHLLCPGCQQQGERTMRKGGTLAGTWPVLGAGEPGGSAAPASSEARSRGEHVDMGLAGDSDRLPVRVDTPRSPEAAEAAPSPAGPSPRSPAPPPGPAARCGWLLL